MYKDQWKEVLAEKDPAASALLDLAIDAYTAGFECEPADYYPGVNAVNLLVQKGTRGAMKEVERLTPLVSFAVARRGGAASDDYWELATVLELAVIARDFKAAEDVLPKALAVVTEGWMATTTADNLDMVLTRRRREDGRARTQRIIKRLRKRAAGRQK